MNDPLPPLPEREYLASMEQLADIRMFAFEEGPARGMRMIHADNGSGLSFTITPDRGMDIVDCRFQGIPLVFRTPVGYSSPAFFDPKDLAWLRNWQGGLLTTSGLRNSGVPNGEFGLHGRASNLPAEDVSLGRGLQEDGKYRLSASGIMREAAMFGENIRWQRTIETAYKQNTITVRDQFTNMGAHEEYLQLLYHCNYGYPFASPSLRFIMPEHTVVPRTAKARRNLRYWDRLELPEPDYEEECFFHELNAGQDGLIHFELYNPELGISVKYSYAPEELPNLVEWKNCLTGSYALGIEPANVSLNGRTADIASGKARKIGAYQTIQTQLQIEFQKKGGNHA